MNRKLVITAAILIGFAIVLGAMAAHGFENKLTEKLLASFEKGVRYQLYASFGILILGLNADRFNFSLAPFFYLKMVGIIFFSGGIYGYCFHEFFPVLKNLVYFVPFGGTAMILAWFVFVFQIYRSHKK